MKKDASTSTPSIKPGYVGPKIENDVFVKATAKKKQVTVGQRTAKGQPTVEIDDAAQYEPVNVKVVKTSKKLTEKDYRLLQKKEEAIQREQDEKRAAKKKKRREPLLTPTWLGVTTIMSLLVFCTGAFCGVGSYILIRVQRETSQHVRADATISSQCFEHLRNKENKNQHCVFEKYATGDDESCNNLCNILHWKVKVSMIFDPLMEFYNEPLLFRRIRVTTSFVSSRAS